MKHENRQPFPSLPPSLTKHLTITKLWRDWPDVSHSATVSLCSWVNSLQNWLIHPELCHSSGKISIFAKDDVSQFRSASKINSF